MPENPLYWLDQIHTSHRALVGDKACYLGLLAQQGYLVVPGFVISSEVFQTFLEQIEWTEPMFADLPNSSLHLDVDNPRQLQAVAQQIRQTMQAAPLPDWLNHLEQHCQEWQAPALILRPSIALPFNLDPTVSLRTTGLLEATVCPVENAAIAQGLKQVWAELFRAKSLLYWQRLRIQLQQIRLAVLIQPIRSVIASGTAQLHNSHADIRAVWGLGHGLVNGDVEPDSYRVDLHTNVHTHQAGMKSIAYEISHSPSSADFPISPPKENYQIQGVTASRQAQAVLTAPQLQTLVHLIQQAAMDLGMLLELEWTLIEVGEPTFYFTQIIPHLNERLHSHINSTEAKTPSTAATLTAATLTTATSDAPTSSTSPTASASRPLVGLPAAPGRSVAPAWVVTQPAIEPMNMPPGCVLVSSSITPDWLPWVKHATGIVTEQGGLTSHGAVLARELGIPAVTGIANATRMIQSGELLMVDGDRGEVCWTDAEASSLIADGMEPLPKPTLREQQLLDRVARAAERETASHAAFGLANTSGLANTDDRPLQMPTTQLFVTLSQASVLQQLSGLPIDGIGLLRSELMMLEILEQRHPQQWLEQGQKAELTQRIAQCIQQFAQAFAPRPVFYRSSDLRSHEFSRLEGYPMPPEPNPALGMRGTLNYQRNPGLFEVELAALRQVQQNGYSNVHLILPFVRTVEEFVGCRQKVEQAGLRQNPHFQLWIMAEVPSVLLLLPDYIAAGAQGVSIGTNDLTQLLLGIDRDQPELASAFDSHHPAVMRAIQQMIQTTRRAQIPCSICGQLTSQYPEVIDALVRWGITAISVDWNDIEPTYQAIVRAEQKLILDAARHRLEG
jgi:pyruvate,water dikinase